MELNVQILRGLATKGEGTKVGPGSPRGRGWELGFNFSWSKVIWPQKGWIKKKKELKNWKKEIHFPLVPNLFPLCSF